MNREQWLNECIKQLRPEFEQLANPLPEKATLDDVDAA